MLLGQEFIDLEVWSSKVLKDFWPHRRKGDELGRESAVGFRWLWGMWDKCPAKQDSPSAWSWRKISACEGEMPMLKTSQEATEAIVPQSSQGNFLQLHFPYKISLREQSSLSQTFNLWKVFSCGSFCSSLLTPHIPATPLIFLRFVSIYHMPSAVPRLFPFHPSSDERDGASPGSPLVLRRDLMCLPAKVQLPAQPMHEALAAGLCSSLLGFLKGKTCQLWEGGQHNDGNRPKLERIARILRYLKCSRTRMI